MLFEFTQRVDKLAEILKEKSVSFSAIKGKYAAITQGNIDFDSHQADLGRSTEAAIILGILSGDYYGNLRQCVLPVVSKKKIKLVGVDGPTGVRITAIPDLMSMSKDRNDIRLLEIKDRNYPFHMDIMQAIWALHVSQIDDDFKNRNSSAMIYYAQSDQVVEITDRESQAMYPWMQSLIFIWRVLSESKSLKGEARADYKNRYLEAFMGWSNQCKYFIQEKYEDDRNNIVDTWMEE